MRKHKKSIAVIFIILLTLGMAPWPFTATPEPYIFGWLPFPVFFWWVLMFINLAFVFWVASVFVKEAKEDQAKKEREELVHGEKNEEVGK